MDWNKRATGLQWEKYGIPLSLNINEKITSDPESIAKKFNMFFCECCT